MLKPKNQVTLFVNYSFPKIHIANRSLCAKIWDFRFYVGVIYGHTFNRYARDWSSYSYTLLMTTNELHWWLLNLLVKSHFKLSIILLYYRKNVLQHK